MSKGLMSDNSRYTKQFRMGKWVDRLLQYSEDISKKYSKNGSLRLPFLTSHKVYYVNFKTSK